MIRADEQIDVSSFGKRKLPEYWSGDVIKCPLVKVNVSCRIINNNKGRVIAKAGHKITKSETSG